MRNVYDVAGRSIGIKLSDHELEFHDKVVVASVTREDDPDGSTRKGESEAVRRMREADEEAARKLREALETGEEPDSNAPCCVVS